MSDTIICPKCKFEIEVTEVLSSQLREQLRKEYDADLQHVHDANGCLCGTILWESKRTKAWSDTWLPKLRNDQRAAKAQLAALASIEMPKGITTLACLDDVWVTSRPCLPGLASALRAGLIEVAAAKRALEVDDSPPDAEL